MFLHVVHNESNEREREREREEANFFTLFASNLSWTSASEEESEKSFAALFNR